LEKYSKFGKYSKNSEKIPPINWIPETKSFFPTTGEGLIWP